MLKKHLTREQKLRWNFIKGLLIGLLLLLITISIFLVKIIPSEKKAESERVLAEYERIKKEQTVFVYKTSRDILQGEALDEKNYMVKPVPKEHVPSDIVKMDSQLKNVVLKLKVAKNTVITNSMLLKKEDTLTADLRKQDFDYITLNKNLQLGDWVDIRMKLKDGTDYVVVAKKQVIVLNGNMMVNKIYEIERQYLNNAVVMAAKKGGILYTTIYVDSQNQPAAGVTYKLDSKVAKMMSLDQKVLKQAMDKLKKEIEKNNKLEEKLDQLKQQNSNINTITQQDALKPNSIDAEGD